MGFIIWGEEVERGGREGFLKILMKSLSELIIPIVCLSIDFSIQSQFLRDSWRLLKIFQSASRQVLASSSSRLFCGSTNAAVFIDPQLHTWMEFMGNIEPEIQHRQASDWPAADDADDAVVVVVAAAAAAGAGTSGEPRTWTSSYRL